MVMNRHNSVFLKFLAVVIIGWVGVVSPSPADAHGSTPYLAGGIVLEKLWVAGVSETAPSEDHATDRHCHGGASICHFQLALSSEYGSWSLRVVGKLTGHEPTMRKDREVVPPHRPPRAILHVA